MRDEYTHRMKKWKFVVDRKMMSFLNGGVNILLKDLQVAEKIKQQLEN